MKWQDWKKYEVKNHHQVIEKGSESKRGKKRKEKGGCRGKTREQEMRDGRMISKMLGNIFQNFCPLRLT